MTAPVPVCSARSAWSSSWPEANRPAGDPLRQVRMIASSPGGSIGRESGGSSETQTLEERGRIAAAEGMRSRRQLVGHHAEREDVDARVDRLRRAAARAPCSRACRDACRSASGRPAPPASPPTMRAMPKSTTFRRPSCAAQHVLGLEIAVHDALAMRRVERLGDLQSAMSRSRSRRSGRPPSAARSVEPRTSSLAMNRSPSISSSA